MKIEFYHIDAFEVANYEPIWRQLRQMGVDARLVAVPGPGNTAQSGWFDVDRFRQYCDERSIDYTEQADPESALGVTTQNAGILRNYKRRVRLMYGPTPYPLAWAMQQHAVQPFNAVLVHGQYHAEAYARWLRPEQLPIIGYPRYDDYFSGKLARAAIRSSWGVNDERPVLMFMPTWGDNTAFDVFFPELLKLHDSYHIILRPHHCTLRMEPNRMAHMRGSGFTILDGAYDLPEAYIGADVVLSDARSGSLFEAFSCDVPCVGMVCNPAELSGWLREFGIDRAAPLCSDPVQLSTVLEAALTPGRYERQRLRWADHHVAYRDGTAAQHAAEALIRLASPQSVQVVVPRVFGCKVSVVLPTYNHVEYLPQAVDSIMKQRMTNFELIIVNDGSTDATAEYLTTLTDPRITVIQRENGGLPSALNRGFQQARGEYRTWTSADNVVGPTWLGQLVAALDAAPSTVGFACSPFALINSQGHFLSIKRGQNVAFDNVISRNPGIASFLYRTTVAEQVGAYDENLTGAEDWDMWLRILEVSDPVYVNDLLYYYRLHTNSMTSSIPDKVARASVAALEALRQRHGGGFDLDRIYPRLREADDVPLARWQARVRLSGYLIDSPYCQVAWSVELLMGALQERYALQVHRNLLHLLCRHGAWELALRSIDETHHPESSPLADLRGLVATRDQRLFQACPIYRIPDQQLTFKPGHGPL